jgi:hypothetical protein
MFSDGKWQLCGEHGDVVRAVPARMASDPGLLADLNRYGARRGWPLLVPGVGWFACVLAGGEHDGHWEYLDPASYSEPPERLLLATVAVPVVPEPAGPQPAVEAAELGGAAVYRRQIQGCGHGRMCPYPYTLDRGRW